MHDLLLQAKNGSTLKIPKRAFMLRDTTDVDVTGKEGARGFSMVALTGKPLDHWWFGKLVIELSGVSFKQKLPALLDHRTDQRVGYTTSISLDAKRGIVAEGKLLGRSEAAKTILADGEDGFPWQASTYLQAKAIEKLAQGQRATVNGKPIDGPAAIFRESTLREVTFTALGVDDDTSAAPLADTDAGEEVAVTLTEYEDETMTKTTTNADDGAGKAAVAAGTTDTITQAQLQEAQKQGREAERQRVTTIRASASGLQAELVDKLIADGTPVEAALLAINEDLRAKLAAPPSVIKQTKAIGKGNTSAVAPSDTAKSDAGDDEAELSEQPGPEKWKADFAKSAKLREEFTNADVYVAFMQNAHRCRDFSNGSQFEQEREPDTNAD